MNDQGAVIQKEIRWAGRDKYPALQNNSNVTNVFTELLQGGCIIVYNGRIRIYGDFTRWRSNRDEMEKRKLYFWTEENCFFHCSNDE